jgi:hypothetical protein
MKINTVLMIFLILITVSYAEQEPEGLGEAPEQSTEREAVESFQNNIETSYAQGKPFEGTAPGNAQINTRLGNINLPSGSQVSTSSAGIHAAKTDSAKTQLGTFSGCKDIYFFDTKEVQAQTCKYLQIASIQASDATEIFVTQTSTKFNTANHLQLQIPNSNDFWNIPNATDITIIFVGNNIQNVRMTLPDTPIILPNPLRLDAGRFQTVGDLNDADADGLSDSFEQINQLNSQNKDSDGDGLTDYEEVMLYPTNAKNTKQSL